MAQQKIYAFLGRIQKFETIMDYDFYFLQDAVIEIGELIFQYFDHELLDLIQSKV
jgi:hypothetical protein